MTDPTTYLLITPTTRIPCRDLAEASRQADRLRRETGESVQLVRARPRQRGAILARMLAERGLVHLRCWYRWGHQSGWYVNERDRGEAGMQQIGGAFAGAVEFIRSGALERCYRRPTR